MRYVRTLVIVDDDDDDDVDDDDEDEDDSGSGGLVFSAGFGRKRRGAVGSDVISQRAHRRRLTSAASTGHLSATGVQVRGERDGR